MSRVGVSVRRLLLVLGVVLVSMPGGWAHRPITSKYTYTRDVLPIFRERCGGCHRPGGVAPMSLLTYDEARPWAQAIKEEVASLRMPPRYAEVGFGPVANGHNLSAREIDTIIDWASGGTPEGPRDQAPPAPPAADGWRLGTPDLELTPAAPFTLPADRLEATPTFVLPTGLTDTRWVRAMDVRPGAPSIVRSVVAWVDPSGAAGRHDAGDPGLTHETPSIEREVLLIWTPGEPPVPLAADMGIRLPPRADLIVRIHYKKTWRQEGEAVSDRTVIGLYFQPAPPRRPIRALHIASASSPATAEGASSDGQGRPGAQEEASAAVSAPVDIVALVPRLRGPLETLRVDVVQPNGTRAPLLLLSRPTPEWPARYWLERPVTLPRGSRIVVAADGAGPLAVQVDYAASGSERPGRRAKP